MKRVLITGATGGIAEAVAREFARRGDALVLMARDPQRLQAVADDLRVRGAGACETLLFDARAPETHGELVQEATRRLGGLDVALIAHGTLSDQRACEQSVELLRDEFTVNALSVMALCTQLAQQFESQGHGVIALISSVAGDRGRQSNYVYGAAKAAVSAFASGLRQSLYPKGIAVVTIKPGFVSTPMTAAFAKNALWASPARVARDIVRAIERGTPVLYTPWFWRFIMLVICAVPERLFRRLRL
ncbi:MAG TPA: SDR family oxidoreductase [Steroidobacteraceae bacterium]|nr:SDR family oxidoreductase [Steroidobacteraceae bacterium]